jgi:phage shock protein E
MGQQPESCGPDRSLFNRKLTIMTWLNWIFIGGAVAAFLAIRRLSLISGANAREYLKSGALVIDVRSPEEFQADRLPETVNIPLGELRNKLPCRVKDKSQVLLLHCLSGGRSGIARHQLKSMGYPNVFNLGSLTRARRIIVQ